jgi:hypothetical protein
MPVEVCSYRLTMRGKPVGTHVLRTHETGRTVNLEAKMMLQGGLGQHTVTQTSVLHRQALFSLRFQEDLASTNERRTFKVEFDRESGLVRASRGTSDTAETPYTRPFQDPLGLLYQIRQLREDADTLRVPMLGKDVVVERLGEIHVETVLGEHKAWVYTLHPGGSYLYVDTQPPHAILKLTQRLEGQLLDVLLVKIDEEEGMPDRDDGDKKRGRKRSRGKRRRGRRGKSKN